ncbi:MAG TPA: tRNA (adenosine(37)-N6)-threonylcarbamoyltransferase complex dimerization subunit type 1 TsaB [Acidimicrobiales bacterium]|nr:tRNA (adenosine(37)-N6)-threonylcarbamoyltransferase complex dimerization subunit type 1 TsaB [Acidimicrobiales bacterium]
MVLALESATELAGVALADGEGVLAQAALTRGRRHAEAMVPTVAFVCERAGVALGAVEAVAVDVGPGLFTGLRVGVATARALATALALPVVAVGSTEVVAAAVAASGLVPEGTEVVAVVDARRGEVFAQRFTVDDGAARPRAEAARHTPEDLATALADAPGVVAGDGARRHAAVLGAVPGVTVAGPAFDHPSPAVLAVLGVARADRGATAAPGAVLPRYLRDADVRINWERRAPRPRLERAP